jgi:hypothetical protein
MTTYLAEASAFVKEISGTAVASIETTRQTHLLVFLQRLSRTRAWEVVSHCYRFVPDSDGYSRRIIIVDGFDIFFQAKYRHHGTQNDLDYGLTVK